MATNANDPNGNNSEVEAPLGAVVTEDATTDPILNKHLDMAIEAQDGKKSVDEATPTESKEPKPEDADKAEGSKTPKNDSTGKSKDDTSQPDTGKPAKEGKEAKGDTRGPKDLVLKGQGPDGSDLIVKGGPERRFYEQAQVAKQQVSHLSSQLQQRDTELGTLRTQLDTMQKSVQSINGLPPQELATAARMFGDLKRDPAGTLKKLLAEAVALGHTVDGIAAGVDVNAITAAVRAEIAQSNTAKEPTEQEVARQAEQEVEQFYSRFSDARVHDALLGAVLRDHPALSLEDAYFQLKSSFIEKGFDWSRSLEDNIKDATSSQEHEQTQTNNEKPLPTGGSGVGNEGSTPAEKHNDVVMSENADYGDIIKAAMREQNLNV